MSDHEQSGPPSPPPPAPSAPYREATATGRHAALPSEPDGSRALRKVLRLEEIVGQPPNPLTEHPGSGMQAVQYKILTKLDAIGTDITAIRTARTARQEWSTWGLRVVLGAILVSMVAGAITLAARVRLDPAPAGGAAARP